MPDSRITALTALTTLTDTDVFPVVDDPTGTPVTKKITALTIKNYVQSLLGSTGTGVATIANAASSTVGTAVVASATPHTKGSYTELHASTSFTAQTLVLTLQTAVAVNATNSLTLIDIAVGGSGSEVDLVSNLVIGGREAYATFILPISVAAGSRISARVQSAIVSKSVTVNVQLRQAGDHSAAASSCTTYGASTSVSAGVTPSTVVSTNTKGAWTEITSSTTGAITRLLVGVTHTGTTSVTASTSLIDIGIGAAASETVLIPDIFAELTATEQIFPTGCALAFTVSIPAGTRISCRYASTSTTTGARPNVAIYGLL